MFSVLQVLGGPWAFLLPPEGESKKCFPSFLFVCFLYFPFYPSSHHDLYSERTTGLSGCCVSNQEPPTPQLYVPPPLPERSCWVTVGLVTALSAITISTAVISLALSPHLWSNPYTSGCTNQWISQLYWYMLCRGTFCCCLWMSD